MSIDTRTIECKKCQKSYYNCLQSDKCGLKECEDCGSKESPHNDIKCYEFRMAFQMRKLLKLD